MTTIRKTILSSILAGVVTGLLFSIFGAIYGLYPFGENSLVWCDMEQQAVPLLLQMKHILASGESLTYTVLSAGGMNFWGVFFFFLSNPLSFLICVTDISASLLVTVLVACKLTIASMTAAVYLRQRAPKLARVSLIVLSVMYGVCGYGLMYYQNLMWLDVQAIFPIFLLGLEQLLTKQKPLLYGITLCSTFILCYYLGVMVVIFLLLYAAVVLHCMVDPKQRRKAAVQLWGTSFVSACLTAWVWLPALLQVQASARSGGILEGLSGHQGIHALDERFALLGSTAIVVAVLPLLWLDRNRNGETRMQWWMCVLLGIATLFDPINAMWHTGSYQAFPYRWGYIVILFLLTVSAQKLSDTQPEPEPSERKRRVLVWGLLCILPIAAVVVEWMMAKQYPKAFFSYVNTLWILDDNIKYLAPSILLYAGAFGALFWLYRHSCIRQRGTAIVMSVLLLMQFPMQYRSYIGETADVDTLYDQSIRTADRIEDEAFYRVGLTKKYMHSNMVGGLGYPTLAHYTSLTREDFMRGVKQMGYSSYWMEVNGVGGTVLTDAIWNVRYLLGQKQDFPSWVETTWTDGVLAIGKSDLTLPMGYWTDAEPETIADLQSGSRIEIQETLAEQVFGEGEWVIPYAATTTKELTLETSEGEEIICTLEDEEKKGEIRFAFFVEEPQALYFDLYRLTGTKIGNSRNNAVQIFMNGRMINSDYPENSDNGLVFLGETDHAYVSVRIVVEESFTCDSFGVFGVPLNQLEAAMDSYEGVDIAYANGEYTANCTLEDARTLVMAIPYDEGLIAEVDGQRQPLYRVNTCQTALRLEPGNHSIVLRFRPRGLALGIGLAIFGILLCFAWWLLRKRISPNGQHHLETISLWGIRVAFGLVLLIVYLFPLIVQIFYLF